jgi:hypothetical protein
MPTLFERLEAYRQAWAGKIGESNMLAHSELYEGATVHGFLLPDGTRVLFRWWGDRVEHFIVPLGKGRRNVGPQSRLSSESEAQLVILLAQADEAAAAHAAV